MESISNSSRRRFLETFAFVLAGSCCGPGLRGALGAITAATTPGTGLFQFKLDDYPALKNLNGSLLVKVPGMAASFPRIVITRLAGDQFVAVTSQCTHQGNPVLPYNASTKVLLCTAHGSQYAPTGEVKHGPATLALTQYPAQFDGAARVTIEIPGLGYSVALEVVAGGNRLKLSFPSVKALKYGVQFRGPSLAGAWGPVSFYLTPADTAPQSSITGTGLPLDVYVDKPGDVGFFAVTRA